MHVPPPPPIEAGVWPLWPWLTDFKINLITTRLKVYCSLFCVCETLDSMIIVRQLQEILIPTTPSTHAPL